MAWVGECEDCGEADDLVYRILVDDYSMLSCLPCIRYRERAKARLEGS